MTFNHPEAFCLMQYETDDGAECEVLWNSRDGVTPFVIPLVSGKEATHVRWAEDRCVPDYVPQPGERVFVDLTQERARAAAERMVNHYWDGPVHRNQRFARDRAENRSKESTIAKLTEAYMEMPGSPSVITAEEYLRGLTS